MAGINLNQLFEDGFGFRPEGEEIEVDENTVFNLRESEKYYKQNPLDLYGRTVFMPVTLNGLFLPYSWITIAGGKKIVETDFTERRGTIKEFISQTDLSINVKGFFINPEKTFPESQIVEFKDLVNVDTAVEIDCPLTDIFLLTNEAGAQDNVIIKNWRLLDNKGVEHVKGYEMNLVTDQELELEIL